MKLTAHEEYGLRCLVQIARQPPGKSLTIPEMSRLEGISPAYAGKILQFLRQGGFVRSVRGQVGGYSLAAPPEKILVRDVMALLGGRIYERGFCRSHRGQPRACIHSADCSVRSLWRTIQGALDDVLGKTTLKDLLRGEAEMSLWLRDQMLSGSRRASASLRQ
ncbi:MAG: Rrf2 family transcriptional regulator [Bryobacterales bacterium]|nr:Rrf2 family transcriptional regulator [Bryobacterales bacterium]